jgi:hypothetical protein
MLGSRRWIWIGVVLVALGLAAEAVATGPALDVADSVVEPGDSIDVTVLGTPGHAYALATSPTNRGLVVQGWPLQLGADAVVVATGQLDAQGRALVVLQPSFGGGSKLYLQAVTAPTAEFGGVVPTPGKRLQNLVATLESRGMRLTATGRPAAGLAAAPGAGTPTVALAAVAGGRGEPLGCVACVDTTSLADGGVTTSKLADGSVTAEKLTPGLLGGTWALAGNAGTDPAAQFLGTTDGQPLEVRVGGARVLRLEPAGPPDTIFGTGPSVVGGLALNSVTPGVVGATLGGGGGTAGGCGAAGAPCPNRITDHFGTVGGGSGNLAGDAAGGVDDQRFATVGGGSKNTASGAIATVSGGQLNTAGGPGAAVGGGFANQASTTAATVGGGQNNTVSGARATVGGGHFNTASGSISTVPGGERGRARLYGQVAHAAGAFASAGDAQTSVYVLRQTTTGSVSGRLFLDGTVASLTIPTDATFAFDGLVVARSDTTVVDAKYIRGIISNNGGTTALVGTPTITELNAAPVFTLSVNADDGIDALTIDVTGVAGQTIRWVATLRTVEVLQAPPAP